MWARHISWTWKCLEVVHEIEYCIQWVIRIFLKKIPYQKNQFFSKWKWNWFCFIFLLSRFQLCVISYSIAFTSLNCIFFFFSSFYFIMHNIKFFNYFFFLSFIIVIGATAAVLDSRQWKWKHERRKNFFHFEVWILNIFCMVFYVDWL